MQLDALAEKDLKILKLKRELTESRKKYREVERSRKEMEGVVGEMKERGREKEEGLQREMRVLRAENSGLRQRVLEVDGHVD
jgi:seryl-tRNA synthetase